MLRESESPISIFPKYFTFPRLLSYGAAHNNTKEPAKGEGDEVVVSVSRQHQREICESNLK